MRSAERQARRGVQPYAIQSLDRAFGEGPHACAKCGATERLEIDHIVPKRLGGDHRKPNLQILCADCHREKSLSDMSGTESEASEISIPGFGDFPSLRAAERATGIGRRTLRKWRERGELHKALNHNPPQTSVNLCIPMHYRGGLYLGRTEVRKDRKVRESRLERDLFYGSIAWDFRTYRKSRRWESLERHMHDGGERECGRCGGAANRLIHADVWTDLMVRPFDLETFAVCAPCRRKMDAERKPQIDRAENQYRNSIRAKPKERDGEGNLTLNEYRLRLRDFRQRNKERANGKANDNR